VEKISTAPIHAIALDPGGNRVSGLNVFKLIEFVADFEAAIRCACEDNPLWLRTAVTLLEAEAGIPEAIEEEKYISSQLRHDCIMSCCAVIERRGLDVSQYFKYIKCKPIQGGK